MRARIRFVRLCAILGLATNLVVAWGCSALASHMLGTSVWYRIAHTSDAPPQSPGAGTRKVYVRYNGFVRRSPGTELFSWDFAFSATSPVAEQVETLVHEIVAERLRVPDLGVAPGVFGLRGHAVGNS